MTVVTGAVLEGGVGREEVSERGNRVSFRGGGGGGNSPPLKAGRPAPLGHGHYPYYTRDMQGIMWGEPDLAGAVTQKVWICLYRNLSIDLYDKN